MRPALKSMSSLMRSNIGVFVAILIDGAGLNPKTDPRPVVNSTRLQPLATSPVTEAGSLPGESMKAKPRVVIGSA